MERCLGDGAGRTLVGGSCAYERTYGSGWSFWTTFYEIKRLDPLCPDDHLVPWTRRQTEDHLGDCIVTQYALRLMPPDSVRRTYLPEIAGAFDQLREENRFRFCVNSKGIKLLTRGFQRFYDKRNPKSGGMKTSFGVDLELRERRIMLSKATAQIAITQANRLFTCMAVGIFFMLRHIHSARGTAMPVHRRNLTSFDKQNKVIPYKQIGRSKAEIVTMNVEFSKTDSSGFGRRVS